MIWTYEDENISIETTDADIKYDAEYMNMFVEQLSDDINWYKERARELERSYVRYHDNETFVGEMANASKNFIYDVQGDELHTINLELKKDFLRTCFDIENRFKEQVDSSSRARISTIVLLKIKKDFGTYYAVVDTKGYEIECHARRLADSYGKWGISTIPCYRRAMMAYEDFCGNGGFLDTCIKKLENFDQESYSVLNRKDFMGNAQVLQAKVKNTASALDSMTVYMPNIAKNSLGMVGFNARLALSRFKFPFVPPILPVMSDAEIERLAKITGAKVEDIKQLVLGYIPQNVSNDTVIYVMNYLSEKNTISDKIIKKHANDNPNQIANVYSSGNYIENQMFWENVKYGDKDMAYSGCEIIAVVNALHSMGKDLSNDEVATLITRFENDGAVLNGTWGTTPSALVDYLQENTEYNITYTTSNEYSKLEKVGENSDTIIVTLYNDDNDISQEIHTINIEKQTDANGNVVYIGHNTFFYDDINGDNDGEADNDEMIPSKKYSSLEDAIRDASHGNNSAPVMVIGISEPCLGDFPESENKPC